MSAGHRAHDDAPAPGANDPGEQTAHAALPALGANVPGKHANHMPKTLVAPAGHALHCALPALDACPAAHVMQLTPTPYVPCGHCAHVALPDTSVAKPTAHALQHAPFVLGFGLDSEMAMPVIVHETHAANTHSPLPLYTRACH